MGSESSARRQVLSVPALTAVTESEAAAVVSCSFVKEPTHMITGQRSITVLNTIRTLGLQRLTHR